MPVLPVKDAQFYLSNFLWKMFDTAIRKHYDSDMTKEEVKIRPMPMLHGTEFLCIMIRKYVEPKIGVK